MRQEEENGRLKSMGSPIFKRLIAVEDAQNIIIRNVERIRDSETVSIDEAVGRVVAENIYATIDVPSFDRATLDGFAVWSADIIGASEETPKRLRVLGYVKTGRVPRGVVRPGTAFRIDTGAMIPKGADVVVPVEYCDANNGVVFVFRSLPSGSNIQWAGGDIMRGEILVPAGTLLLPRHIGGLSASGISRIRVWRRPRIAVFSIGDELIGLDQEPSAGMIYDINTYTISSLLRLLGCTPIILGRTPDDPEAIARRIEEGLRRGDLVVSTGGSSVGQSDLVVRSLMRAGGTILFHGVMSKPGKPVLVARIGRKLYIGLPGNPTSAMVSFMLYVKPAVMAMLGCDAEHIDNITIRLRRREYGGGGRRLYRMIAIKIRRPSDYTYEPLPPASESISTMLKSDGYFVVPEGLEFLEKGHTVIARVLDGVLQHADILLVGEFSPSILGVLTETTHDMGLHVRYIRKSRESALQSYEDHVADIAIISGHIGGCDLLIRRRLILIARKREGILASAYNISVRGYRTIRVGTHQSAIFRYTQGYADAIIVPEEIARLYGLRGERFGFEELSVLIGNRHREHIIGILRGLGDEI